MINKRSKLSKYRGSKTHGCGSMKKRRGAGNRGGRGNAGSGKRGDAKKPSYWKTKYLGKSGFVKKGISSTVLTQTINISKLENSLQSLIEKKFAIENNNVFDVDLTKAGYGKLLSQGKVLNKFNIKISSASPKSIEKIKGAGGSITIKEIAKKEINDQ